MRWKAGDRVFSDDNHALQQARLSPIDHVHECRAGHGRNIRFPSASQLRAMLRTREVQCARQEFRHRPHFDSALVVVLLSQWSETTTRLSQFAGEQQEIEKLETGAVAAGTAQKFLPRENDDSSALGDLGSYLSEGFACGSRHCFKIGP